MIAVVQRVRSAEVRVATELVGRCGPGLLVLLGVAEDDGAADEDYLIAKIPALRIFPDAAGKLHLALHQTQGDLLVVSQFTLLADTRAGNRPSFTRAARPEQAQARYLRVVAGLERVLGRPVATGRFGADMQVTLTNDGPVTIILRSRPDAAG